MKKNVLALCLAVSCVMTGLSGCGGQKAAKDVKTEAGAAAGTTKSGEVKTGGAENSGTSAGGAESGTAESGAPGEAEGEKKEFSYPMSEGETLTWWQALNANVSTNFSSFGETPLARELTERTGVEVEYIHPPLGQEKEQLGLILADGDLPDLLEYNWLVSYPGGPQKALSDGVIIPLNDVIDQYCPNLKKYLEENPEIDQMIKTDDGEYYAFPKVRSKDDCVLIGPMMRGDWLKELNLEVPETLDDWHSVLTAFKTEKGAKAPFTFQYTQARMRNVNPILLAYDISPEFYLGDDGTVHYGSIEPGYKQYLETFSKWYEEGLIDVDLASLKLDQVSAKMTSGDSGAAIGLTEGNMGLWMNAGRKDNPDFQLIAVPWPVTEKGKTPELGQVENEYAGINSVSITTSCEDVERAARLMDYNYGEEGHMLCNFGIEGVTYNMVDGYPQYTDVILNNPDGWTVKGALGAYTRAASGGSYIQDSRASEQSMNMPELVEARYEVWPKTNARNHLLPPITPNKDESKEFATIMNEITTYRDEMTIKFIMKQESLDTFDKYVENIKKLGIDRALEIQNAALKRYQNR